MTAAPAANAAAQPTALAAYTQADRSATVSALGDTAEATQATAEHPKTALIATPEISSPDTVTLEPPTAAPRATSAPSGARNLGLIGGALLLVLLIGAGVVLALRRRE
jgi:hypothetical protein